MKNHPHTADGEFRHLLFQYLEFAIKKSLSKDQEIALWNQVIDIIDKDLVTPATVIQCAAEMFEKYPSRKLFILHLLEAFRFTRFTKNNGYSYPEFLWIIVKEHILSEAEHISDLMRVLSKIISLDTLRAYLNYQLLTEDKAKYGDFVRSYYYTGHDIESLKLVAQIVPVQNNDLDLLNDHYLTAMSFVFGRDLSTTTSEEKTWLKSYFADGLAIGHPGISESCNKALAQLEMLT